MKNRGPFWLLMSLLMLPAEAHEVTTNRATLVLREANHLSLTLRINLANLMRDVLVPKKAPNEFLEQFAAMPSGEFEAQYLRVQTHVQTQTRLVLSSGKSVSLGQWRWPDTKRLQAEIRDNAMQMAVSPHDHLPELDNEVYVEGTSKEELSEVTLQLARQLRPILVVNYRPHQVWMAPQTSEIRLRF